MPERVILGLSAYYHDSAAAIVVDGRIVAAAQEERFTRKKHDPGFPIQAIRYCLDQADLGLREVSSIVFYDKPLLKFERLLETYLSFAPRGFASFLAAMPIWLKEKLFLKSTLRSELCKFDGVTRQTLPELLFTEHHHSHAASAYFPSPFDRAAVLCLDGVGEWATTSAWLGEGADLAPLWEIEFPHSLGLLYSAFTYFTGFKVNSGEYKLMGLAPYGKPRYVDQIRRELIDLKDDGTFRLNLEYFDYCTGLRMTNARFERLFDGPARRPESKLTNREMDIAASIQVVTEEVVLRLARGIHRETGQRYLCLAGGVALNCVANGRLLREGPFEDIWIQPAAGDAGGALGAALAVWYGKGAESRPCPTRDAMAGAFLGPRFERTAIEQALNEAGAVYTWLDDEALFSELADRLADQAVIGWFQGRMEFGPRSLGARSIIGDPRSERMQSVMNLKIKYRESFRPFAPAVLAEDVSRYFELDRASPYMLLVAPIQRDLREPILAEQENLFGIDKLNVRRSSIPAVTHVDYSARVQTVDSTTNPRFHRLLSQFKVRTGCSVLVNTSFNVRGEPIVCTPADAYRCFMRTEMDCLVIENFVLLKSNQPVRASDESWKTEFELD